MNAEGLETRGRIGAFAFAVEQEKVIGAREIGGQTERIVAMVRGLESMGFAVDSQGDLAGPRGPDAEFGFAGGEDVRAGVHVRRPPDLREEARRRGLC